MLIMSRILIRLLLYGLLLLASPASAETAQWSGNERNLPLEGHTQSWVDTSGDASLGDVRSLPREAWTPEEPPSISHGYVDEPYWFRTRIHNPTDAPLSPYLEIGYPALHHIDLHVLSGGETVQTQTMGNQLPFGQRPLEHRNFVIPLQLAPGETLTVLMRVETGSSMQVPLTLWESEAFLVYEQSDLLFQGIYFGIAVAMIFYHIFVYIAVRERAFLYYIGYISAMPLFLATLGGLAYQFLWPGATWWNNQLMMIFLMSVVVFGALFTIRFLSINSDNHPFLLRATSNLIAAALLIILVALFVPFSTIVLPSIGVAFVACCLMLLVGIVRLLKGVQAARYYTVAWFAMLAGGIILALSKFALLPNTVFTQNAVQVGSGLGVIVLSFAIADRLNKEKKAALEAQQQALREERNARMAQAETLRVQEEANTRLEHRVHERTEALEAANAKLLEFSTTDALTGLRNRGYFEEVFPNYCVEAFRYRQPLSVMVLDIDHFKAFNDRYGHLVGDDCLRMVAECIANLVTRPEDIVARYGGEEFVVVLPDTTAEGARCVAERIRRRVAETPFQVSRETIHLTVSIGISGRIPETVEITQRLFEDADQALYAAKHSGRNRVTVDGDGQPA